MNVLGYRLHVPIFCNSDIQPKLPEVCFVQNALRASSQAILPRHLYPGLQAASWASSLLRGCGYEAMPFPICGCLALVADLFFNSVFVPGCSDDGFCL